jgi:ubiquinone/menaquinone biosynthesis C-methylase UbiE
MTMAHKRSDEWERFARKIDRGISRRLTRPLYARLLAVAAPRPSERLLDVGAGSGNVVAGALASGAGALGIDASNAMALVAVTKVPGRFVVGRAERLPFADASFDIVTTSLSLHHWEPVEAGLREIARVLEPDGRLVIADVEGGGALARIHNSLRSHHCHGRYITRDEYDELLRGAGFVKLSQEVLRRRWVLTLAKLA